MNNIKNTFTIKDLENLTGIKAHTIRVWEKRYGILEPMRTDTNIRVYDTHSLQRLLNINTLNNYGYKISQIAQFSDEKVQDMVRDIQGRRTNMDYIVNSFKMAMMNFDQQLFFKTYIALEADKSFRDIFYDCFMPLLEEIGNLWQTNTVTPAHEHFISNLIKQKIMVRTEPLQIAEPEFTERTYILYLPEGEIHEIGLMLINYELLSKGYRTVYLGESVPLENLAEIKNTFDNITFVTYITVEPSPFDIPDYFEKVKAQITDDTTTEHLVFGRSARYIGNQFGDAIKGYAYLKDFTEFL